MQQVTLDIDALRAGETPPRLNRALIVLMLAFPAVLAELSNTLMQYIDAGMVGHIGAHATASIGIVESTIWLLDGLLGCAAAGFTVQVAQLIGAGRDRDARQVMRQSLVMMTLFSGCLLLLGVVIAPHLPAWIGGEESLRQDASQYFLICCISLIPVGIVRLATGMFQCAGDMRTPSILNIVACVLDVCFNAFLINESFIPPIPGRPLHWPGFGLGIFGAALGTLSAQTIVAAIMLWILLRRSPTLALRESDSWTPRAAVLRVSGKVSGPMFLERIVISLGYMAITVIVAPLGTIAVAANSLAIT
ncbi:MAG: hypothetical protein IJ125_04700, partial [Atopobiaceae bacterium]|nr:hypothetical protein [Atopobiaceae bacterium]